MSACRCAGLQAEADAADDDGVAEALVDVEQLDGGGHRSGCWSVASAKAAAARGASPPHPEPAEDDQGQEGQPRGRRADVDGQPEEPLGDLAGRRRHKEVHHLQAADEADDRDQRDGRRHRVGADQPAQPPVPPCRAVHGQHAGQPERHEQHDGQEHEAEVEQPDRRVVAEHRLEEREHDGPEDGAGEGADAADVRHEQDGPGGAEPHVLGGEDLVVHREQSTRHAGEEAARRRTRRSGPSAGCSRRTRRARGCRGRHWPSGPPACGRTHTWPPR